MPKRQHLTAHRCEQLPDGRHYDNDRAAKGLLLQVQGSSRVWIMRYEKHGRQRALGLGSFPLISLKEARQRAIAARLLLDQNIDPIDAKRAARRDRNTISFKEAAEKYSAAHEAEWSSAVHRNQFSSSLTNYVFPIFGNTPVDQIDTPQVLRVLQPIWKTKTETASRIRGRIESILDWSRVAGYRSGDNVARWKGHLDHLLASPGRIAKVTNHLSLPFAQIHEFIMELRKRQGTAARALEFLILTAARTSEVTEATWDEIDLTTKVVWTIPPERMKAKKEHRVPLVESAIQILNGLPRERGNDHVFLGTAHGQGLNVQAMGRLLKQQMKFNGIASVHGMRATFKTWASEATNFPSDVIEMALAHLVGSQVERAYRRGDMLDKRRELMLAWADFIERPATVVPIRALG